MRLLIILFSFYIIVGCSTDDVDEITDTVEEITFTSLPPKETDHDVKFSYNFEAVSQNGMSLTYNLAGPAWLSLDTASEKISGTPGWGNENTTFTITIIATDGVNNGLQSFELLVNAGEVNCDTVFNDPAESAYILPYNPGESYRMWQSYCHPQFSHRLWFSYDFEMPIGTEIIASRAGVVLFERDHFADGTRQSGEENFIFIQHSDGTVVHYVHLTQNGSFVEVGQAVEQGEVIGLSGDSGGSAGPHLHTTQFRPSTNNLRFNRQYSLPMNYRNTDGSHNENNGLVEDVFYLALPY